MKIGVIGVGRLGLCYALLLDQAGHTVLGYDIRTDYVKDLQSRRIRTTEPDVEELLSASNILFVEQLDQLVQDSDIIYVMVATPSLASGRYDVGSIQDVVDYIVTKPLNIHNKIFVIGCTTNPGDCVQFESQLARLGASVLYNPEFIAQGSIIRDLRQADMVLIGGSDTQALATYQGIYYDIQTTVPTIHTMGLTAAEIVKIAVNCFLTTKISYANMIGQVLIKSNQAQHIDAALTAIGSDTRIGSKYLGFGFGYGGPCLPRDNRALADYMKSLGMEHNIGHVIDEFNQSHNNFLFEYIQQQNHESRAYYIPNIAYKPMTDILEESQQLRLAELILQNQLTLYIEPSELITVSEQRRLQTLGAIFRTKLTIQEPVFVIDF